METLNWFASVRRLSAACAVTITVIVVQGCDGSRQPEHLTIDREVLVGGVTGPPNVMVSGPHGNFLVAGARGVAWAAGLSPQGEVLWQFEQPQDASLRTAHQSEYHGAVALPNGNYLLCGEVQTPQGSLGLITILDRTGRAVDDRRLAANNDRRFFSSSFYQCIAWEEGILVLGEATDGTHGYAWLMRLNKDGLKEWETVSADLAGSFAVETPAHDLLLATGAADGAQETTLFRLGRKAEILSSRSIKSNGYTLLRSTQSGAVGTVILNEGGKTMVHSLNAHLEDMEVPKAIPLINISHPAAQGCGYVLPDNSLALFGYIQKGGDLFTLPYTAVVAHVGGSGKDAIHTFAPHYPSVTITDAVRISDNRFVTVRNAVSEKASETGIVLSWITF